MAVIATAELSVDAPLELAFQRFLDFSAWDLWMPPSIQPVTGPARELRAGDRVTLDVGGTAPRVRTQIEVIRVRPTREICWRGRVPGLLVAEHSFFFAEHAGRTTIRSEEPLRGLLTVGPLASRLERLCMRTAHDILAGFAAFIAGSR